MPNRFLLLEPPEQSFFGLCLDWSFRGFCYFGEQRKSKRILVKNRCYSSCEA